MRGRKVWTTKAPYCEKVLLLVRTTPLEECARRTDGMTLLLADLQRPEVDIRPIPKIGRNAVVSCEVRYDDLPVAGRRPRRRGGPWASPTCSTGSTPSASSSRPRRSASARPRSAGPSQYANERVVFGRPIGMNQGLAFPLAEAYADLHAAELVIREAAWRYDHGLPCGEHANIAKCLAADAGYDAADRAMQTHGGMGYAKEYDVERYWREARLMRIAPDHPGDGPQLRRRARPRPAPQLRHVTSRRAIRVLGDPRWRVRHSGALPHSSEES